MIAALYYSRNFLKPDYRRYLKGLCHNGCMRRPGAYIRRERRNAVFMHAGGFRRRQIIRYNDYGFLEFRQVGVLCAYKIFQYAPAYITYIAYALPEILVIYLGKNLYVFL